MISNWPIQRRMYSVMASSFLVGTTVLLASLLLFSNIHIQHEREPVEELGSSLAKAIGTTIRNNPGHADALKSLLLELNQSRSTTFHLNNTPTAPNHELQAVGGVPSWFTTLVEPKRQTPVTFDIPEMSGQLALKPDMAADIYEKWIAFLAAVSVPLFIALTTLLIARNLMLGLMRPLLSIKGGINALRTGVYDQRLDVDGPREVVETAEELNSLSETLHSLRSTNLALNRKLLIVQETERAEIAQDLHDELGPLLFALRANTAAVVGRTRDTELHYVSAQLNEIAESIQKTNRRILDRLRLTTIAELGVTGSIAALLDGPAVRAGKLVTDINIDPSLDALDELSASTIYRIVQESLTNALRHSSATKLTVRANQSQVPNIRGIHLSISDNGIGYPVSAPRGRGISGMEERLHALGGTFSINGSAAGTSTICFVPVV